MKRPVFDVAWPPDVAEIYHNDLREMWDRDIERHSFNSYHNQLDFYASLVARAGARTVLDVGCAQGTLALTLAERGCDVTAVDIRGQFLRYGVSRYEKGTVRFIEANLMDRPDLGQFDLVFGNQIIEHLVRPVQFLRNLSNYVRPGGTLVVTTPNHAYFRSSLPSFTDLGDPSRYEEREHSAGGGDHFFAYTPEELSRFALEAGLEEVEVVFYETPFISGHAFLRFAHPFVPVRILSALDRLALHVAPRTLAHQLCLIARNPAGASA